MNHFKQAHARCNQRTFQWMTVQWCWRFCWNKSACRLQLISFGHLQLSKFLYVVICSANALSASASERNTIKNAAILHNQRRSTAAHTQIFEARNCNQIFRLKKMSEICRVSREPKIIGIKLIITWQQLTAGNEKRSGNRWKPLA